VTARRWAAALALTAAACAAPRPALHGTPGREGAPSSRPPPISLDPAAQHDEVALEGVVHVVQRGETVWRIARAYAIDPADLMETNGLSDPRTLAAGTELFVPGAARVVEVPPAPVAGDPAPHAGTAEAGPTSHTPATGHAAAAPHPSTSTSTSTSATASTSTGARQPHRELSSHTPAPVPAPVTAPASLTPRPKTDDGTSRLAWPLKGVLYGRYGVRGGRRHDGIDIAAPEGTTVSAAGAGTVIYAGEQTGYGAIVIVRHDAGLVTLYAHNSRLLVDEGSKVRRGEPIARVGQTGRTTGPHLHFEVREGTRPRNPLLYLP
jgi:murein DD-endopeptidase MepM/ murein hydrolase activator NlpD